MNGIYIVEPVTSPVRGVARVPGSKSITNRALVLGALAEGQSTIRGALFAEDTLVMAECLSRLGFRVETHEEEETFRIAGAGGHIPAPSAELFVGNSGTTMRFLAALCALGTGPYRLDGVPRMRQRPIQDLLTALRELGVEATSEAGNGCPPVTIRCGSCPPDCVPLRGGRVHVNATASSQFLSAVLMIGPVLVQGLEVSVEGALVSRPYVEMTMRMMRDWGAHVDEVAPSLLRVRGASGYRAQTYRVEPDASAASYFFAAAAVTGGEVRVEGLGAASLQGDVAFVDVLERMGCSVDRGARSITLKGPERLNGVNVDMNSIPDTVMTLAAIAPFATSPTTIRNVENLRYKETDRLAALVTELAKLGVPVEGHFDGLTIHPCSTLHPAEVETYGDHRIAMSFAITGLRTPGIAIRNPECVNKTFPDFFLRLEEFCRGARGVRR
ncbi:MAG: 3-phosphoshikimate 1-carboxyvinyltransferase [Chthonomonadales bacterium]